MFLSDFIEKLIEKKSIDREIIKLSKNVDDFPLAYHILKKIDGSDFLRTILNPKSIGQIELAAGDLKRHCFVDGGLKRNPFLPCWIISEQNPTSLATGMQLDIIASTSGIGPPSKLEVERKTFIFL